MTKQRDPEVTMRRTRVARLRERGWSVRQIAEHIGAPVSTVHMDAWLTAGGVSKRAPRQVRCEHCGGLTTIPPRGVKP